MFGSDGSPIVQYIVIFAVIFTVLAAIVFLVRRLTGGGTALQTRGARARQPRLGIVDVYELDRARQLILLRRDNVEHLLLVGGPNDVVVERNIQRGQRPLPEATLRPEPVAEPLPDPLAEAGRLPEPPRAIAEPSARRAEPAFEMPVVVPAPVPGSSAAPPVRLPLDAALLGGDEPGQDLPAPAATPREPFRGRTQRPTVPAPERAPEVERVPEPTPAEPVVLASLTPQPTENRSVDPKVLSDMARQLQAAIARPSSAVTPPPEPAELPRTESLAAMMAAFDRRGEPAPATARTPPAPSPVAPPPAPAAMPAAPTVIVPPVPPVQAPVNPAPVTPPPATAIPPQPRVPPAAERPLPPPIPPRPEPTPPRFEAKPTATKPDFPKPDFTVDPPAEPKFDVGDSKSLANPFSVEEIEAEFARLLGRPLDKRG